MEKINIISSLFLLSSLSFQTLAANLEEQFKTLTKTLPHATVALIVQDLENGKVLFEHRAQENFYPASNTKLFTAAAALKKLGKDYHYETTLSQQGENIYLTFSGDPSFTHQDLFRLLQTLPTNNITKINGHLIIDDTAFDKVSFAPGWTQDSIPWYYGSPVQTIIINENKVRFNIAQSKTVGKKIAISQNDKAYAEFKLTNNVIGATNEQAENQCQLLPSIKNNEFILNGCWPIQRTPTQLEMAIDNPRLLAQDLIKAYLKQLHVELAGSIVFAKAPSNLPALATHQSAPLSSLLTNVLADSNNLYSESLTKTLGNKEGALGSFHSGTCAIKKVLKESIQVNLDQQRLRDGSGLSRYNLITPERISHLLFAMYHDPAFNDFYSTLSIAGKTGTLTNRLKDKAFAGKVVAKTGSATGTSALSGYLTGNSGKTYLFVIMINQATKESAVLKEFEDKLCQILIQEPWLG